jgi:CRP-like cAMP-binding protein
MRDSNPIALRRLLALRQFPVLASAELAELAVVADNVVEAAFPAGARVAAAARLPALHLIVDGRIEMRTPQADGVPGERITAWEQREAFGMLEVLGGRRLAAPAIAATDTRTLRLSASDLADILEDNLGLLVAMLRDLARRVAALDLPPQAPPLAPCGSRTQPLDLVERMVVLRTQVPILSRRLEPLAMLAHAIEELRFDAGETIAAGDEIARDAFVLLAGAASLSRDAGPDDVAGPGAAIGLLETMGGLRYGATITAMVPTRALRIPSAMLFDVIEDHPELGVAVVGAFAGTLLDASGTASPGTRCDDERRSQTIPLALEKARLGITGWRRRSPRSSAGGS